MTENKIISSLKKFLKESGKVDYANSDPKNWKKEKDGSSTIYYESGEWSSHDNFFGGEPYGGRTVVHYKGIPIWMFIYYGSVEPQVKNIQEVYDFLKSALNADPENKTFRGPKLYVRKKYKYVNTWKGSVEKFEGEEQIYQGKTIIYGANYMGGLVNQRKDEETS